MTVTTEMQRRDEGQMLSAERTRTEPVFTPAVDIYETNDALILLADLPGVSKDDLNIRLEDDVLTLEGVALADAAPAGEPLLTEYRTGTFFRQFTLSEAIDRDKIDAQLNHGVLKLVLPKAEAAKPKRIEVKAG